jgi:hypothetical protein
MMGKVKVYRILGWILVAYGVVRGIVFLLSKLAWEAINDLPTKNQDRARLLKSMPFL